MSDIIKKMFINFDFKNVLVSEYVKMYNFIYRDSKETSAIFSLYA